MTMLPAILTIEGGVYFMAVLVITEQYIQNSMIWPNAFITINLLFVFCVFRFPHALFDAGIRI